MAVAIPLCPSNPRPIANYLTELDRPAVVSEKARQVLSEVLSHHALPLTVKLIGYRVFLYLPIDSVP